MMLSQLSVIVCLLLVCLSSDGQFCTTSPLQLMPPTFDVCKHNAYCKISEQNASLRHSECNYSCVRRPELEITNKVVNSSLGIMEVIFTPFTLCNFNMYEVTLFVNETGTEDACSSVTYDDTRKHSSKSMFVETCEPGGRCTSGEPCDENVTLVFNHLFSGCYLFKIQPKVGSSSRRASWTLPQYITTDYKKKLVTGVQPNFSLQYYKSSEIVEVSIAFPFLSRASLLTLIEGVDPILGLDACHESGYKHSSCKMCTDESKIECDAKGLYNDSCKYLKGGVLTCVLHNVSPDYYCARIEFIDDRCATSSVWVDDEIDPCVWHSDVKYLGANATDNNNSGVLDSEVRSKYSSHTTAFIVVPVLVISSIFLLSLLAFVAYRQLQAQYRVFIPTYNKELKPLHVKERPTVLLLYARDCDMFMDVMEEFRSILKSSLKCQVFDCWDPVHYEDVAHSPTDWILRLISDKSVRIVLVATPCSRLLEVSLLTDKKVQYRQPDAFDKLFIFALKHLTETTILDSYSRIFVVRLDKNTQNINSSLTYLNPLTVYSLPTHLDKLMLGLHRVDAMEYAVSISEIPDVKHFSSSVESFQSFVHENPYYLDFLLEKADPDII